MPAAKNDDDKPKATPKGHYNDLTDGTPAEPKAEAAIAPNPDPKAKDAEAREHDTDVDPAVLPDNLEPAASDHDEPEAPRERIEDLLKDKTFDRDGKVRVQLARLLSAGHEMAPPDLVAMGR